MMENNSFSVNFILMNLAISFALLSQNNLVYGLEYIYQLIRTGDYVMLNEGEQKSYTISLKITPISNLLTPRNLTFKISKDDK